MSPRKQVPLLYHLALRKVKTCVDSFFVHHLNVCTLHEQNVRNPRNCGKLMNARKDFLQNLNSNVIEDLLCIFGEESDYNNVGNVQRCALPFLCHSELKKFHSSIGTLQDAWVTVNPFLLMSTLLLYGRHIVKLTIINGFTDPVLFRDALVNMPDLEFLRIDANDTLLKIIGQTCNKLSHLDISRGIAVTKEGLLTLCYSDYPENMVCNKCCSTLEVISLPNEITANGKLFQRVPEEATILLVTMMKLKSLGVYRFVGEAMTQVIRNNKKFSPNFVYIEETRMYYSRWDILPQYCKNVEQIKLSDSLTQKNLPYLCQFRKCNRITFQHCYWTDLQLYLEIKGSLLQELNLRTVQGTPVLSRINELCPYLRKLSLRARTYKCSMTQPFQKLECFVITQWKTQDSIPLLHLIKNMPMLKTLCIANCNDITDEDVAKLTCIHSFLHLENLLFSNCSNLTFNSLRIVIEHCPRLRYIGDVFRLEKKYIFDECKILITELQECNYDLKLVRAEEFKKNFLQTGFRF